MQMFNYLSKENFCDDYFIPVPKSLYKVEFYASNLSNDAILLYGLLKDRLNLSISNGVKDEDGNYYVIASVESMAKMIRLSKNTVRKLIKELKSVNLIILEPMKGYNASRKIYISTINNTRDNSVHFESPNNATQFNKFYDERDSKFGSNTSQNLKPNNNYTNNNSFNNKAEEKYEYREEFVFED